MKRPLIQLACALAVIALPLFTGTAEACSCMPMPAPYEAFGGAKAVFIGKVINSNVPSYDELRRKPYPATESRSRFLVEEPLKGVKVGEVEVSTGRTDSSCYVGFTVGESYLVYAYGGPDYTVLYTGMCTRTLTLSRAQDEAHYLRAMLKGAPEPRVYGSVGRYDADFSKGGYLVTPLEGIKVIIEGGGRLFEDFTDQRGLFSLDKVPDGEYKARPVLPDKYRISWPAEEEFVLGARAPELSAVFDKHHGPSAFARFHVTWSNEVSGRILDSGGNPVKRAKAALVSLRSGAGSPLLLEEDRNNLAEGKYRFSGLTPGSYVPAVSIKAPFKDARPTRFYFPGVTDPARAGEITVGEKDTLTGKDIRLPVGYLVRRVEGVLVWADGSHVGDKGWVLLSDTDEDVPGLDISRTDAQGRFSVEGFVGAEYWVRASVMGSDAKVQPFKVEVKNVNEPLRIVVPAPMK